MQTIHHVLDIDAPRESVFTVLTTTSGLSSWWTTKVEANEMALGTLFDVTFGPFNPHLRITEFDCPARVTWEGVRGHDAWGESTTIRFELEAKSGGTMVRFWHQLGQELSDDAVGIATFTWGYYLDSLRLYCETGDGKPFRNPAPPEQ